MNGTSHKTSASASAGSATSLLDLPTELLERIILSYPEGPTRATSWTTLRLTSRTFNSLVTPHLFKHLTLWLQTQSLQRLVRISQTPHLQQLVQSLEIGTEFLGMRNPSQHEFTQTLFRFLRDWKDPYTPLTMDDISNIVHKPDLGAPDHPIYLAWQTYCTLVREQSTLIRTSMDVAYLGIAFSNLPRLSSIRLTMRKSHSDPASWGSHAVEDQIIASPSFLGMSYQPLMNGHWLRTLVVSLAASGRGSASLQFLELDGVYEWADFNKSDLDAARLAFPNLTCLSLSLGRFKSGLENRLIHFLDPTRFPRLAHLKLSLRDAAVQVPGHRSLRAVAATMGRISDRPIYQAPPLWRPPTSAQSWMQMHSEWELHPEMLPESRSVLGCVRIPTLRCLELVAFKVHPEGLETLLREHAASLNRLELQDAVLDPETWEELFGMVREVGVVQELVLRGYLVQGVAPADGGGGGLGNGEMSVQSLNQQSAVVDGAEVPSTVVGESGDQGELVLVASPNPHDPSMPAPEEGKLWVTYCPSAAVKAQIQDFVIRKTDIFPQELMSVESCFEM